MSPTYIEVSEYVYMRTVNSFRMIVQTRISGSVFTKNFKNVHLRYEHPLEII